MFLPWGGYFWNIKCQETQPCGIFMYTFNCREVGYQVWDTIYALSVWKDRKSVPRWWRLSKCPVGLIEALGSLDEGMVLVGFPCGSVVKNPPGNAEDTGSIPGSERSLGEVFLPGKSHGQRSLACYSPWDREIFRHDLEAKQCNAKESWQPLFTRGSYAYI